MQMTRRREGAVLAAIIALFLVSLGRAASYDFVWDDVTELKTNPAFDRPLADGILLTQTARTNPELVELTTIKLAYDSYRPLLFASFWIDIQLFGRSASALHVINVLLGVLAIVLAHLLARRWIEPPLALCATALFALHPVQIEAVAYISGRGDLLAGVLALAATLAARRALLAERAVGMTAIAAVAFAASLLAKEAYLGLPIAIGALAWAEGRLRARWWVPAALVGIVGLYLVVRAALVTATTGGAVSSALVALPGILLEYVRIFALPFDLSTARMIEPAYTVPGWLIAAAALGVTLWRGHRNRHLVAAAVWFVVLLAPSAIPVASLRVVADRYAYLALLGAAIAAAGGAALLLRRVPRLRVPLLAVAALWAALVLVVAWRQVPMWRDNHTLYTNDAEMAPRSSGAQYRLGLLEIAAGNHAEAIARFEAALALDADHVLALNNLGVLRLRTGNPAAARDALARAVELAPAHFRAWYNLGLAKLATGDAAGGCAAIRRALEINPSYQPARAEVTSAGGRCSP